jgi:putative membrane protein insertion efficiency factor
MTRVILLKTHALYKAVLSPLLHAPALGLATNCRFQPTCSEYATLALAQHGPARGLWLSATRLLRCHPFARGGWDPVPPAHQSRVPHP